jgi:hypothetical protein
MAFNLHAYGNLFIHPFNCDTLQNEHLKLNFTEFSNIYDEIWYESGMPRGNIKGNGETAIKYQANGEASDWMLGKYQILAMSPELGNTDPLSQTFFIRYENTLKNVVM